MSMIYHLIWSTVWVMSHHLNIAEMQHNWPKQNKCFKKKKKIVQHIYFCFSRVLMPKANAFPVPLPTHKSLFWLLLQFVWYISGESDWAINASSAC